MENLRINKELRKNAITIFINGRKTEAYKGEMVHAALVAAGYKIFHKARGENEFRGYFCGMGICYDCLVSINGKANQRACMNEVEDQMEIVIYEQ